jgi:hypothetical protein
VARRHLGRSNWVISAALQRHYELISTNSEFWVQFPCKEHFVRLPLQGGGEQIGLNGRRDICCCTMACRRRINLRPTMVNEKLELS